VKLLFCGDVDAKWDVLAGRLTELQQSKNGPFDLLLICGRFENSVEANKVHFPMKAYCFVDKRDTIDIDNVPVNVEVVRGCCGIISIDYNLTVGYSIGTSAENDVANSDLDLVKQIVDGPGYRGCDVLITSNWPRGMHHFLEDAERQELCNSSIGIGSGQKSAADLALLVRPRYHFVAGMGCFYQRSPYRNIDLSGVRSAYTSFTRLLAIDKVSGSSSTSSKDKKAHKWLHALSINPIIHLSNSELSDCPIGTTDCPYIDVGVGVSGAITSSAAVLGRSGGKNPFSGGVGNIDSSSASDPPGKRQRLDSSRPPLPPGPPPPVATAAPTTAGGSGSFFFGTMGVPAAANGSGASGSGSGSAATLNLIAPSTTATTLFIGGLLRDMTEGDLMSILMPAGVQQIRRPPGKSFAFAKFETHEAAKKVVESAARKGLALNGRTLTVGWGKEKPPAAAAAAAQELSQHQRETITPYAAASSERAEEADAQYERQLVPPSEDAKTLFIGGVTQEALGDDSTHNETETRDSASSSAGTPETTCGPAPAVPPKVLRDLLPGLVSFKLHPTKSFGFAEFVDYAAAMNVVTESLARPLKLNGQALTVGWANSPGEPRGRSRGEPFVPQLVTEAPSADARVLFLGNIPIGATELDVKNILLLPDSKPPIDTAGGDGMIAVSPIANIKRPEGRSYAFVEFLTFLDAQRVMQHVYGSVAAPAGDGNGDGENLSSTRQNSLVLMGNTLYVGWAKGRAADKASQSAECWFCLASPVVKVHLIVSVGEHSYIALPRGSIAPKHVQIAPIECVPSKVHLSNVTKSEMLRFQQAIESLFHSQGYSCLRFERALRTKGSRDHMQVHVIPIPATTAAAASILSNSFRIFLQKASSHQLKFHEIQDEQSIDEVVVSMAGGPYQEYFYIEIPVSVSVSMDVSSSTVSSSRHRRFVYVQEEGVRKFPMQFGLEVAAEILGQPERGHWKHNLLEEKQEAELCDRFREEFAPFDFTLTD